MTTFVCRSCGNPSVHPILSLGPTPLANALLTFEQLTQAEATYPLDLVFCPHCALVQITETLPPEQLFREYVYFSSFSETTVSSARQVAERLMIDRALGPSSLVMEIASNDGYLLQHYHRHGIPVLGIEPARNIAKVAEERGLRTIAEFFDTELAGRLRAAGKQADVLHANNVIAHVAMLHDVVGGIALALKPDGIAVVENHYVRDLIERVEFDSIYHEHLCYYSATAFDRLFRQHSLTLVDVEHIPAHGGSLRAFFQRTDGPRSIELGGGGERVREFLQGEGAWGVSGFNCYCAFGQKVAELRHDLLALLRQLKAQSKRLAVYGASAKSTTLLNYLGLGSDTLEFAVDRSTVKQGRYTPGTHLPIYAPEKLLEAQPDYVLLLAWNFVDEVLAQQSEYRRQGGRFIVPIPELQII